MKDIISVQNLTKKFNNKIAIDNLSFSVKKGECFGLLGHNGAGKSTTIDCILGLKSCDRGESTILGLNPKKNRKEVLNA